MKPTRILTLVGWAVPTATLGYLISKFTTANGGQVPVTPINLILTFITIAIILGILALPMVRYRRALTEQTKTPNAPRPKRLNPFYAVRLLVLAKATAISGSMFTGWHVGVIWMQLSSPVTPQSIWQNVSGLVASIVMVVIGVIVERICRITDEGGSAESATPNLTNPAATSPTAPSTTAGASKVSTSRESLNR